MCLKRSQRLISAISENFAHVRVDFKVAKNRRRVQTICSRVGSGLLYLLHRV
jgi:hypothetical protein